MIKRIKEGDFRPQGISWFKNSSSDYVISLKIWRFYLYLRKRAKWLCEGENTCKRYVFTWGIHEGFK